MPIWKGSCMSGGINEHLEGCSHIWKAAHGLAPTTGSQEVPKWNFKEEVSIWNFKEVPQWNFKGKVPKWNFKAFMTGPRVRAPSCAPHPQPEGSHSNSWDFIIPELLQLLISWLLHSSWGKPDDFSQAGSWGAGTSPGLSRAPQKRLCVIPASSSPADSEASSTAPAPKPRAQHIPSRKALIPWCFCVVFLGCFFFLFPNPPHIPGSSLISGISCPVSVWFPNGRATPAPVLAGNYRERRALGPAFEGVLILTLTKLPGPSQGLGTVRAAWTDGFQGAVYCTDQVYNS